MEKTTVHMWHYCRNKLHGGWNFLITLLLWIYFTFGFIFLFSAFYFFSALFSAKPEMAFQRLNAQFYQGFFFLVRILMPSHKWLIEEKIRTIRSSVIVCNHVSYIDSILLISLYKRHTTIAKERLFYIPLFGWMLKLSGYIPSVARGKLAELMLKRIESLPKYLKDGGNLIIFPEGTRGKNGCIGSLNSGAFKIARQCRAPIKVLFVRNTEKLFKPGKFSFNALSKNIISVKLIEELSPNYHNGKISVRDISRKVRHLFESENAVHTSR